MLTFDNKQIGRNLQRTRKTAGLTQREVARLADCSPTSISLWESGNLSITVNKLLALMNLYMEHYPDGIEKPSMDDILGFRPVTITAPNGTEIKVTPRDAMVMELASMPLVVVEEEVR